MTTFGLPASGRDEGNEPPRTAQQQSAPTAYSEQGGQLLTGRTDVFTPPPMPGSPSISPAADVWGFPKPAASTSINSTTSGISACSRDSGYASELARHRPTPRASMGYYYGTYRTAGEMPNGSEIFQAHDTTAGRYRTFKYLDGTSASKQPPMRPVYKTTPPALRAGKGDLPSYSSSIIRIKRETSAEPPSSDDQAEDAPHTPPRLVAGGPDKSSLHDSSDKSTPVKREHSPGMPDDDTVARPGVVQNRSKTADRPINHLAADQTENADFISDTGTWLRSPSPWQSLGNAESQQSFIGSLRLILSRLEVEIPESQASTDSSPEDLGVGPLEALPAEGARTRAAGSGTGPSLPPSALISGQDSNGVAASAGLAGSKRSSREARGGDEDGGDDERTRKRLRPGSPGQTLARPRLACPYQKHDPFGSPFCCMPCSKNPEGGAKDFSRVK